MTSVRPQGTSANLRWHVAFPPSVNSSSESETTDFPFNEYDFPREIWRVRPASQVAVKVVTFIPVMLLGLLGNGAVLLLVCRRSAMRTPVSLLLASMAVSDLLIATVLPSLTMVEDFFQNWVLGPTMCKLEGFLMLLLSLSSALNLVAVSLLRLISIAAPTGAVQARFSNAAAIRLAVVLWLVAAILASPLLRWRHYRERQWRNFLEQYCTENQERLGVYWLTAGALLVWLPLLVILASYAVMFVRLEVTARRAARRGSGAPAAVRGRDRVAVMLCVASIVYLVCWTPFAAVIVKRYMLPDEADAVTEAFRSLWYAAHYLMYANAAFDPIIYWATNETFRRGFRETFVARGRRATAVAGGASEEAAKSLKTVVSTQMTVEENTVKNVLKEGENSSVTNKEETHTLGSVKEGEGAQKTALMLDRNDVMKATDAEEAKQQAKQQVEKGSVEEQTLQVDFQQGKWDLRL